MDIILALLAGALTTLSPCVLPLLPFVLASASEQHRLGPLALTAGMSLSFVTLGISVFGLGAALEIGPDRATVRMLTAVLLLSLGVVLLSAALQLKFALAGSRLTQFLNPLLERFFYIWFARTSGFGRIAGGGMDTVFRPDSGCCNRTGVGQRHFSPCRRAHGVVQRRCILAFNGISLWLAPYAASAPGKAGATRAHRQAVVGKHASYDGTSDHAWSR